jgi:hypothetical protein
MSRESHKRYLECAALREAQKAFGAKTPGSFSRDSFGQLRIQTVEPWKRILFAAIGVLFLSVGFVVICTEPVWMGAIFAAIGIGLLTFAWFCRRKTIDAALDGIDVIHLATQLLDAF